MSEAVILAILAVLGGSGGIYTVIKVIVDFRAAGREQKFTAEERLVARLEARITRLEEQALSDEDYINRLASALIREGIEVPSRDETRTNTGEERI